MGDYTKNGTKIGACGRAYYSTLPMLQEELKKNYTDSEIKSYLEPKNKSWFAFPYPEFDNKKIGEISIFHKENHELIILKISKTNKTHHKQIVTHLHPSGGQGINLFCDCPYHSTENVSRNFNDDFIRFYLKYEMFTGENDNKAIVGECIYCGESNVFEKHEAEEAAKNLIDEANYEQKQSERKEYENTSNKDTHINKSLHLRQIANRILNTYK